MLQVVVLAAPPLGRIQLERPNSILKKHNNAIFSPLNSKFYAQTELISYRAYQRISRLSRLRFRANNRWRSAVAFSIKAPNYHSQQPRSPDRSPDTVR